MLSFIQRHSREIFLFLFAMLGIALGYLVSTILGGFVLPSTTGQGSRPVERVAPRQKPTLADFEIILQRNIFDSSAPVAVSLKDFTETPARQAAAAEAKPAPRVDLVLLGTVSAESGALALIGDGKTHDIYRVGSEVPGGGKVKEITRNQVTIENSDGSESLLTLYEDESMQGRRPAAASTSAPPTSPAPTVTGEGQIRPVGENRWIVDRQVAEDARTNIGELLKSARMEPNVVDGKTAGFVVKMIQPRSLLANLGIRRGDIIMEVNGVELSSPEKALQIFQQLREARNISIALLRGGSPMNFEFEIE